MIDLNPLVIERHFINPPKDVQPDEENCVWYSMTDKIDYWPGGKVSGDVSYTCGFHDLPNGIQTHCRAPLGVDIREKWTLNGSLPGEPPEPAEIGIGAPASGLYIREDVDLRCNVLMTRFVKKNLQKSHAALVDKLVAKAKEISAQRRASIAQGNAALSPPAVAQALSRPWSPPRYPSAQSHQRHASTGAYTASQNSSQEGRSPSPQAGTHLVENFQPVRHSYSGASSHQLASPYRASLQPSSQGHFYPASPPALRITPQHRAPLPAVRPVQQHYSYRKLLPYPVDEDEDQDVTPAPLRTGNLGHIVCGASTYTASSRSRSSSDLEHPMYPHLSPYSSEFTDRSSSPDEPRTPESGRPTKEPMDHFYDVAHPDVLKPGCWRQSRRLSGPHVAGYE
ncbi:hypothetical protein N0V93_007433 [Gnomoniopsis smithogilvyi]|uniref:DUF7053 domain-containing protein n=1 Tax=Gnomoniopsis smithogilvyi TaxID=1191159 RepID=A0A9W9CWL5_9PEZI|nr:hypothetical protein N0V93_007433 [Gnomoniopsis smithogilvyi]